MDARFSGEITQLRLYRRRETVSTGDKCSVSRPIPLKNPTGCSAPLFICSQSVTSTARQTSQLFTH